MNRPHLMPFRHPHHQRAKTHHHPKPIHRDNLSHSRSHRPLMQNFLESPCHSRSHHHLKQSRRDRRPHSRNHHPPKPFLLLHSHSNRYYFHETWLEQG
jgi:hypothetical protein